MSDTSSFESARIFIHCLRLGMTKNKKVHNAFKQLTWEELKNHVNGSCPSEAADEVCNLVRHYNNRPGHVSRKITAGCKFGPRVEYIK